MAIFLPTVKFGNGKHGSPDAISGVINTYATCTGTVTQTTLTTTLSATLGDVILIYQTQGTGAGQRETNYVIADNGATLTLALPLSYTYTTGAQVVLLKQYTGGTLSNTITGSAWNGSINGVVAAMFNGNLTISGSVTAKGIGFRGGQSVSGANKTGYQGESSIGTGSQSNLRNGSASGGGQGSTDNSASSGSSHATEGAIVGNSQAGSVQGSADLSSVFLGAGSGSGGTEGDGSAVSAAGAIGGGYILLFVKQLTVTGTINCNGNDGNSTTSPESSASSGAAAGTIEIYSQLPILGTNKITALGGAGATAGAGGQNSSYGGNGRIRINYYSSVSGTTNPTMSSAQNTSLQSFIYSGMI